MDLNDFNSYYLNRLLDKVFKEQKSIFLFRHFNVDLLNYNIHSPTNPFRDSLFTLKLTTNHSKTLYNHGGSYKITVACLSICLSVRQFGIFLRNGT